LMRVGKENPDLCKKPPPKIRMRGFGASSLDFNLMAWIKRPEDRGRISHDLYIAIYKLFTEYNIEIPFTKQDLYIKEWPTGDARSSPVPSSMPSSSPPKK
jgi:MscS family membrane protein